MVADSNSDEAKLGNMLEESWEYKSDSTIALFPNLTKARTLKLFRTLVASPHSFPLSPPPP